MADLETSHATLDHTGLTGVGGAPAESDVTFTDITTNNASTSKHGYLKKLDNNSAHFMDGTGAWSTPSAGGITRTTQGTTSAGASFVTRGMFLKQLVLASDGLVSSIHAFIKGDGSTAVAFVPIIMTDSSNNPINHLLSPWPSITSTPTRVLGAILNTTVRDLSMPVGRWMTAGTYWFGVYISDNNGSPVYLASTGSGGTGATVSGGAVNQPVDSSISSITTNSVDYSIYIDVLR